jgi:DNA polymerase-1
MQPLELPNVRKLFRPDPGYFIFEGDLSKADAQVVAWDAGDEKLKEVFRSGKNLHLENAIAIFGGCDKEDNSDIRYYRAKQGVHMVNYGAQPNTVSTILKISLREAEHFIDSWFAAHPDIARWHNRIEQQLQTTREVRNAFGNRRKYLTRIDDKLLKEALAWIPQSTVALVINRIWKAFDTHLPIIQVLLQVHDSLVFQLRESDRALVLPTAFELTKVPVPYPDLLIIPMGLKCSPASWGNCQKTQWR